MCAESANAVSNKARLQDTLVPVLLLVFLALVPSDVKSPLWGVCVLELGSCHLQRFWTNNKYAHEEQGWIS